MNYQDEVCRFCGRKLSKERKRMMCCDYRCLDLYLDKKYTEKKEIKNGRR